MEAIIRSPILSSESRVLQRHLGGKVVDQSINKSDEVAGSDNSISTVDEINSFAMQLNAEREKYLQLVTLHDKELRKVNDDLSKVRNELQSVKERQSDEIANVLESAQQQGYEEGVGKGELAGRNQFTNTILKFETIIEALSLTRKNALLGLEDIAIEIAFSAVCRILGESIHNKLLTTDIVNKALQTFSENDKLIVRLNPQDYAQLKEITLSSDTALIHQHVELRADPNIKFGGCVVDSNLGAIDARLESQINRLYETILSIRKARTAEGSL